MAALLTRLSLTWLAATVLPAAPAAPDACRVELVPGDAPRVWVTAALALRESLREGPAADRDCRRVVIHAGADHPSVEVTTLDGRRGVRRLADARDVEPTVAALIVTVLGDRAVAVEEASSHVAASLDQPAVVPARPEGIPVGWRPLVVASGGGRLTLPGTPAPLLELSLGVVHPYWELALYGAWAPTTLAIGSAGQTGYSSSADVAVTAARRQNLGNSGVDAIFGLRAGVIVLSDALGMNGAEGVAPAAAALLGAAFPRRARVRLRSQLWFQWATATRVGGQNAPSGLASVGLSIGAESRLP